MFLLLFLLCPLHAQVDVMTGAFHIEEVDLVSAGHEPLAWSRSYCHTDPYEPRYASWSFNPELFIMEDLEKTSDILYDKVMDPKNPARFNYQGEIINADGSISFFETGMHAWNSIKHFKEGYLGNTTPIGPSAWTPYHLRVYKKRLKNGNTIRYDWIPFQEELALPTPKLLSKMTVFNPSGQVLNELTFSYRTKMRREKYPPFAQKQNVKHIDGFEVKDRCGRSVHYYYEGRKKKCLKEVIASGKVPVKYSYDEGRLSQITYPEGRFLRIEYQDNKVVKEISPYGVVRSYTYYPDYTEVRDGEGYLTIYRFNQAVEVYDQKGLYHTYFPIEEEKRVAEPFIYDGNKIIARKFKTYDHCGICTRVVIDNGSHPDPEVMDGVSYRSVKTVQPKYSMPCFGLPESEMLNGCTTHYTYTPSGQIASKNGQVFTYENERLVCDGEREYRYDLNGNCIFELDLETGNYIERRFDLCNRLIEEIVEGQEVRSWTYDQRSLPISYSNGDQTTHYAYDCLGRCILEVRPDGRRHHWEYDPDGNVTYEKDLSSRETFMRYHSNQLVEKKSSKGLESYTYHKDGTLATYCNDQGARITYERDVMGNPIKETHLIDGHVIKCIERSYSPFTLLSESDAIGTTNYSYDQAGRLIQKGHEFFGYDDQGRVCSRTFGETTEHLVYDKKGVVVEKITKDTSGKVILQEECPPIAIGLSEKVKDVAKADGRHLMHEYDALGRLVRHHGPDFDYHYTYDCRDRIILALDALTGEQTKRTYDADGNLTCEILANGVQLQSRFNQYGQRIELMLPNESSIHYHYLANQLYSVEYKGLTYTYAKRDLKGRAHICLLPKKLGEVRYHYDGVRLTEIDSPYYSAKLRYKGHLSSAWVRDPLGERTLSYQYDREGRLLKEEGLGPCTYDPNGNLINDSVNLYTYDSLNRLIRVDTPDESVEYQYDAFNRRIRANDRYYIWDDQEEIGEVGCDLLILGDRGMPVLCEVGGECYVLLQDFQGNTAVVVSPKNGEVCDVCQYAPFGAELTESWIPWRYANRRYECGLMDFGRRYYHVELGHFITPDPLGEVDGCDLYAYARGNPLEYSDTYGMFSVWKWMRSWFSSEECSGVYLIEGKRLEGQTLTYANGMRTTLEEAKKMAQYISDTHGGVEVKLLYNQTHGYVGDLARCALGKLGVRTSAEKMMTKFYREQLQADPKHRFVSYFHSRSGIYMENAEKKLRCVPKQQIDVITLGSGAALRKGMYGATRNFASRYDLVPLVSPFEYGCSFFGFTSTFDFIKPHTSSVLEEHSALGRTYGGLIKTLGEAYR